MSDPVPRLGLAVLSLLVCAGYYLGTLLGYAFIFPSSYISIVWPPNTILLVALLLSPRRQWAWLLAIAFPVHLLAQAQFGVSLQDGFAVLRLRLRPPPDHGGRAALVWTRHP